MEFINKKEMLDTIQKFIDARANKNCSKQSIVEKQAFLYVKEVVNKLKVYEFENKDL